MTHVFCVYQKNELALYNYLDIKESIERAKIDSKRNL
jgi:hypothetical protein